MKMGFELSLKQTQKLVMTPELRQAIKLLQYNSYELDEYLEKQLESNPLIERETRKEKDEVDWKEYSNQYSDTSYKKVNRDKDEYNYENFITKEESLKEHLIFQIDLTLLNLQDKVIATFLVESIDSNGYLKTPIDDISKHLKVGKEKIEEILDIIQTFEPIGVGARNLRECLKIQLKHKKLNDKDIIIIIDDYLEDVGANRLNKISKDLDISIDRVQDICDTIKELEPKPGRGFPSDDDDIKYVKPDVVLEEVDGEYVIKVNDTTAPRLIINNFYKDMLNNPNNNNNEASKFINNKLNSAMWLIKSIEQRRMTIFKVVSAIVEHQRKFFDSGEKFLKPLTLKEIAEEIEMHESTVSRATNGKYIQTPRGLFELKYFFTTGLKGDSGKVASTTGIKSILEELIENENPKKPLSDQKISDVLKGKDIKISRRTVAKYRDELNIPSSSKRRRY